MSQVQAAGKDAGEGAGAAMLREICERPDDDSVRLIYADWLDEQGQSVRAEYIRLQVEYARLFPHLAEHARSGCPVCRRARELSEAILDRRFLVPRDGPAPWAQDCPWRLCGLKKSRTGRIADWVWLRGFVARIEIPLALFLGCAHILFRAHPITEVALTDRQPIQVEYDDGTPYLRWWRASQNPGYNDLELSYAYVLPEEIFDLLPGEPRWNESSPGHWRFSAVRRSTTPAGEIFIDYPDDDARAAISRACVAWGRQQAGLPPYVKPPAKRIR